MLKVKVICGGKKHRVVLTKKGHLSFPDHAGLDDPVFADYRMLHGEPCRCEEIMLVWKQKNNLDKIWNKLPRELAEVRAAMDRKSLMRWRCQSGGGDPLRVKAGWLNDLAERKALKIMRQLYGGLGGKTLFHIHPTNFINDHFGVDIVLTGAIETVQIIGASIQPVPFLKAYLKHKGVAVAPNGSRVFLFKETEPKSMAYYRTLPVLGPDERFVSVGWYDPVLERGERRCAVMSNDGHIKQFLSY